MENIGKVFEEVVVAIDWFSNLLLSVPGPWVQIVGLMLITFFTAVLVTEAVVRIFTANAPTIFSGDGSIAYFLIAIIRPFVVVAVGATVWSYVYPAMQEAMPAQYALALVSCIVLGAVIGIVQAIERPIQDRRAVIYRKAVHSLIYNMHYRSESELAPSRVYEWLGNDVQNLPGVQGAFQLAQNDADEAELAELSAGRPLAGRHMRDNADETRYQEL